MYEINLDKNEQFKCKINLQGSNLKSTNVRLRIQPDNNPIGLVFEGVINTETGFCNIDIGKLKKYIDEDITGKIILEVVVDNDTYFEP